MYTSEQIKQMAREQYEWAVNTRRALHRIPEKGFEEHKTRALIAQRLEEIGVEYDMPSGGWITAYVPGNQPGKITAIRADFDALPITEPEGCPFGSVHPGYMHACGHDMHTAVLLSLGRLLKNAPDGFSGGCLLMFEPAEETEGGAKPMAKSGMMEKYGVDRVYGLHVMPRLIIGQVETRPLTLNAGTDSVFIRVRGTRSHGAYPENGTDAIVCASALVTALQTLVSRNVSPLENAVLTIGTIKGGEASNIICDEVEMTGTLRTADRTLHDKMVRRILETCEGTGKAFRCRIEAEVKEGYSALVNTPEHAARVLETAKELFGSENALIKEAPSMGAEDFSYFLDHAPGAFFHVGCSPDADHIGAPLHSEKFCPDERAMEIGIAMEAALVMRP